MGERIGFFKAPNTCLYASHTSLGHILIQTGTILEDPDKRGFIMFHFMDHLKC